MIFQNILLIFETEFTNNTDNTTERDMEEYKKNNSYENEKEIVFSQTIKAGKRIYYIDVKKNRKEDMYLSITESKKIVSGEDAQVSFEKHKIFLYREDFEKFSKSLRQAIDFVVAEQGEYQPRTYETASETAAPDTTEENDLKIDIEF